MTTPTFTYFVEFESNNGSITYSIDSTTPDLDHDEVSDRAEKELVKMWGAPIPSDYVVVHVTVSSDES